MSKTQEVDEFDIDLAAINVTVGADKKVPMGSTTCTESGTCF